MHKHSVPHIQRRICLHTHVTEKENNNAKHTHTQKTFTIGERTCICVGAQKQSKLSERLVGSFLALQ